jgi:hypothetical protein
VTKVSGCNEQTSPLFSELGRDTGLRNNLWFDPIPAELREGALTEPWNGNVEAFLWRASNACSLWLVWEYRRVLKALGLYERALLEAFIATRTNNRNFPLRAVKTLFALADRAGPRDAGDPLPGVGPFVLFRGVAGIGSARRVQGYAWTASLSEAWWFATRLPLPNPAVHKAVIDEPDILAYTNRRNEEEFVVMPGDYKIVRVPKCDPVD